MFCANSCTQLPLIDPLDQMPKYLRELLEKGWVKDFRELIFPYINERSFAELYSANPATCPNSPVNVLIGLLILKEVMQQSDEELIGSLHFDKRYQYALHTMDLPKQPVSINTLTNFRNRLTKHLEKTGIDLLQIEVEAMAAHIAQHLKIDQNLMRMDSLMISSSCKKLSSIELVYSVNHCMVKTLAKIAPAAIPDSCKRYLEKKHKNEVIYRTRDEETDSKLVALLKQTEAASSAGEKVTASKAFLILSRFIQEQTNPTEDGRLIPKPGKEISPQSLQNPTDPDATYRWKHGGHTGYVGNVLNAYDGKNQVTTHFDLEPNTYSDQKFADETIGFLASGNLPDNTTTDTEKIILSTDGAYYTDELAQKAAANNINLIPGQLTGTKPETEKLGYDQFKVDVETHQVNECPGGQKPDDSYHDVKGKCYTVKMEKKKCDACQFKEQCPMKPQKKMNVIHFSEKRYHNDQMRTRMGTEDYRKLANCRAGVEGIPSVLRRRYRVDEMPIRGLVRAKIWFDFKIAAMNFKSLVKGSRRMAKIYFVHFCSRLKTKIYSFFKVRSLNNAYYLENC
jgi:hypothetical protein